MATDPKKRFALEQLGLNPDQYDYDDNYQVTEIKPSATTSNQEDTFDVKPKPTKFESAITAAKANIGSGLGGLGAAALGGLALSGVGTVPAILGTLLASAGGAALGGAAQNKVEEAVMQPDRLAQLQSERQTAEETNPLSYMTGAMASQLPFIAPSPKSLGLAAKAGFKALTPFSKSAVSGSTIGPHEVQALKNVAMGGGIGAGMEAFNQATSDQPMDLSKIATSGVLNAVVNDPTKLGQKVLGLTPNITKQEAFNKMNAKQLERQDQIDAYETKRAEEQALIEKYKSDPNLKKLSADQSITPEQIANAKKLVESDAQRVVEKRLNQPKLSEEDVYKEIKTKDSLNKVSEDAKEKDYNKLQNIEKSKRDELDRLADKQIEDEWNAQIAQEEAANGVKLEEARKLDIFKRIHDRVIDEQAKNQFTKERRLTAQEQAEADNIVRQNTQQVIEQRKAAQPESVDYVDRYAKMRQKQIDSAFAEQEAKKAELDKITKSQSKDEIKEFEKAEVLRQDEARRIALEKIAQRNKEQTKVQQAVKEAPTVVPKEVPVVKEPLAFTFGKKAKPIVKQPVEQSKPVFKNVDEYIAKRNKLSEEAINKPELYSEIDKMDVDNKDLYQQMQERLKAERAASKAVPVKKVPATERVTEVSAPVEKVAPSVKAPVTEKVSVEKPSKQKKVNVPKEPEPLPILNPKEQQALALSHELYEAEKVSKEVASNAIKEYFDKNPNGSMMGYWRQKDKQGESAAAISAEAKVHDLNRKMNALFDSGADMDKVNAHRPREHFEIDQTTPQKGYNIDQEQERNIAFGHGVTQITQSIPKTSSTLGSFNRETQGVRINPEKRDSTTLLHESLHSFVNNINKTGSKTGKYLIDRANNLIKKGEPLFTDKQAEEKLVTESSVKANELQRMRDQNEWGRMFKQWAKDVVSHVKVNRGKGDIEDVTNVMARRLLDDVWYKKDLTKAYAALEASIKGKAPVGEVLKQESENIEEQSAPAVKTNPPEQHVYDSSKDLHKFSPLNSVVDNVRRVAGDKVANSIDDFWRRNSRNYGEYVNEPIRKLHDLLFTDKITSKEYFNELWNNDSAIANRVRQQFEDIQDGKKPAPLTGKAKEAFDLINNYFIKIANETNSRNANTGLMRRMSNSGNYLPNMPKREVIDILLQDVNTPQYKKLKKEFIDYANKQGRNGPEEFDIFQNSYVKSGEVNLANQFGPLDKAAGIGLPPSWREKNLMSIISRYGNRVARRLAYHDAIESAPEDIKNALLKPTNSTITDAMEQVAGVTDKTEANRELASSWAKTGMMQALTGAKDLVSSLFNGYQHMDINQVVPATISAVKNVKINLERAYSTGVARERIASLDSYDQSNPNDMFNIHNRASRLRDLAQKLSGREYFENTGRAIDFGMGHYLAADAAGRYKRGVGLDSQMKKFLEDFGPEDWKTKFKKDPTAEDLNEIAAKFVESVQGTYDARGLPAIAMRGTWAPILSLARWNIEKFNNFKKYVVAPAIKDNNWTPFLMQTLGATVGGSAVAGIVKLMTGRKDKTASLKELQYAYDNDKEFADSLAYKMAALWSLSGYAGIVGDLTKMSLDRLHGNNAQGYNNVLIDSISRNANTISDFVTAHNGDKIDMMLSLVNKLAEDNIQNYRLIYRMANGESKETIERQNKLRDLRTFKQLSGLDTTDVSKISGNPFDRTTEKDFKRSKDLEESYKMLPDLLKSAREEASKNGTFDIEAYQAALGRLKHNSYQTMPSSETPRLMSQYYKFLEETQSPQEAAKRLEDYMKQKQINKVKAGMIP